VHGLARGFDSWTSTGSRGKKRPWLTNLLAEEIPNLRIINYKYDHAALVSQVLVRKVLYARAMQLWQTLVDLRQKTETSKRPIVFIAHNLGGWIVHRALLLSSEAAKIELRDVQISTAGIVQFGTPDSSAQPEELAKVIQRILCLSLPSSRLSRAEKDVILSEIKWLSMEMESVKPMIERIPMVSFFEIETTKGVGVVSLPPTT
jgi:hypothetical protein